MPEWSGMVKRQNISRPRVCSTVMSLFLSVLVGNGLLVQPALGAPQASLEEDDLSAEFFQSERSWFGRVHSASTFQAEHGETRLKLSCQPADHCDNPSLHETKPDFFGD